MRILNVFIGSLLASLPLIQPAFADSDISVGGTVRAIYSYKDYSDSSKDTLGNLNFDMAAIKFDGKVGDWGLSSEYRFYDGWDALRYGFAYYDVKENLQIQMGVVNVPFGKPGFISNSMWFGLPYYVGFEDDYDLGVKGIYHSDNATTEFAFFKNGEYGSSRADQYSVDIINTTIDGVSFSNKETNQVNFRQVFNFKHESFNINIGYSGQFGQLYNTSTGNNGERAAFAAHMDASWNDWTIQLQAMHYRYSAADAAEPNEIAVGSYNWSYLIASKANVYSFNIAKKINTEWGSLTFYNDFGLLDPKTSDSSFNNSYMNVTGCLIATGPIYTYVDLISGKNMYASSTNDHVGLTNNGDGWGSRININFGYYF